MFMVQESWQPSHLNAEKLDEDWVEALILGMILNIIKSWHGL